MAAAVRPWPDRANARRQSIAGNYQRAARPSLDSWLVKERRGCVLEPAPPRTAGCGDADLEWRAVSAGDAYLPPRWSDERARRLSTSLAAPLVAGENRLAEAEGEGNVPR